MDLQELSCFLVKAKRQTYAADGKELPPQRPGFRELLFQEGQWEYRDSYCGFYYAPGQEVVRFAGEPVWTMAYSGGMLPKHHGNYEFAKEAYTFLKNALSNVTASRPFRGPSRLQDGDWRYADSNVGDVKQFSGRERIYCKGKLVYEQHYCGGMIVQKIPHTKATKR